MTMNGNSLRTLVFICLEETASVMLIFLSMDPIVKHYNWNQKYFNLLEHYILMDECRDVDKSPICDLTLRISLN